MNPNQEYINYKLILEEFFPKSIFLKNFTSSINKKVFLNINDNLKFINLLLDFDLIKEDSNSVFFIKEYKIYLSRILTVLATNDRFLLNSILRLNIEKLYRIIYGINFTMSTDRSIRKKTRKQMSDRIKGDTNIEIEGLDTLYSNYSIEIHHGDKSTIDLRSIYDIMKDDTYIDYSLLNDDLIIINSYWLDCVLCRLIQENPSSFISTNLNIFIRQNFSDIVCESILPVVNSNS